MQINPLLRAFGSTPVSIFLPGVWAAEENTIASVAVGKRKVGPVVAKRLYGLLHN